MEKRAYPDMELAQDVLGNKERLRKGTPHTQWLWVISVVVLA